MLELAKYSSHCLDWPSLHTPHDHIRAITDGAKWGLHWLFFGTADGQRGTRGQEYVDVQRELQTKPVCDRIAGAPQVYVTAQRFGRSRSGQGRFGQRLVDNLSSINHIVVDVDTSHEEGAPPTAVQIDGDIGVALARLNASGIPLPSFLVVTGRGFQMWWLHSLLPEQATQRWLRVTKELCRTLGRADESGQKLNVDQAATTNLAGVYRVVGTVNVLARSELQSVSGHWIAGPERYSFEALAKAICPRGRRDFKVPASNATTRSRSKADGASRTGSLDAGSRIALIDKLVADTLNSGAGFDQALMKVPIETLSKGSRKYVRILFDLGLLAHSCFLGGIPPGYRDQFLWILTVALTHLLPPSVVEATLVRRARAHGINLTESEIAHFMGSTLRRAYQAASGVKSQYQGRDVDQRYRPDRQNLFRRIGGLVEDLATLRLLNIERLTFIVSRSRALELMTQRQAQRDKARSRAGQGELRRQAYCHRASNRREEAMHLKAVGHSVKEIARKLGLAISTVYQYLRHALWITDSKGSERQDLSTASPQSSAVQSTGFNSKGRSPGEAPDGHCQSQKRSAKGSSRGLDVGMGEPAVTDSVPAVAPKAPPPLAFSSGVPLRAGRAGRTRLRSPSERRSRSLEGVGGELKHCQQRAGSGRGRFSDEVLQRLKTADVAEFLKRWEIGLSICARIDATFAPTHDASTSRWHVGTASHDYELVITRERWFDTRAKVGGVGVVDLLMHLLDLTFVQAVKQILALDQFARA